MNAGKQLASMRKMETKECANPECNTVFTGLVKKQYCDRCMRNMKQRRYDAKKRGESS